LNKKPYRLLFVCSGNLHRSVMAAALSGAMMDQAGHQTIIGSAGTLGLQGHAAPPEVASVCRAMGLDVSDHLSRPLTRSLIQVAEAVVVMEEKHGDAVLRLAPEAEERLFFLGDYADIPADISDPIGQNLEAFRKSRDHILACLQRLLPELLTHLKLIRV
jgi:protein-tyrosine-phosphatase